MVAVSYDGTSFQLQSTLGVSSFSGGATGLTPSSATTGAITLAGVLGKLNGGTGALTASVSFVARAANVATITTASAHGFVTNDYVTVAAVTNTGFNGNFTVTSTPTSTSFTYAQVGSTVGTTADTGTVTDLSAINLTTNVTGILYPTFGGTGLATLPTGNVLIGNATSSVTTVAPSKNGQSFVVTAGSSITAGAFVIGATYTITSVGTTSFTSIGASANTVGIAFTATGVGSGTGTATLNTWAAGSSILLDTVQNSTSGTSINFTNVPSWAKRVTVMLNGVSANGTSSFLVQLGASSIETSGYGGSASGGSSSSANSSGFIISSNQAASNVYSGIATIQNVTSNTWVIAGSTSGDGAYIATTFSGNKTLSGTLAQLRFTTVNGTDTFDAGSINLTYE